MDRKLMMQYLEHISRLECQVYTLKGAYQNLDKHIKSLGHPCSIEKPKDAGGVVGAIGFILFNPTAWGLLKFIFIIVLPLSFAVPVFTTGKFPSLWSMVKIPLIIWLALRILAIPFEIIGIINANRAYRNDLEKYDADVAADSLRVQKELRVKAALCAQRDAVSEEYQAAESALTALYNLNIIEREYRDFAAITTFYSYFRKEYCTSLAGPNQAYDRYDQALKIGEIINKLDIIINKLDEIADNQVYLAELLRDSNNTLLRIEQGNQKMLKSMEAVEENSSLTEYNTRCAAESSRATAMLTLYNTLK